MLALDSYHPSSAEAVGLLNLTGWCIGRRPPGWTGQGPVLPEQSPDGWGGGGSAELEKLQSNTQSWKDHNPQNKAESVVHGRVCHYQGRARQVRR